MDTRNETSRSWTAFQIGLAIMLVITGSLNTLSTKWADKQSSVDSSGHMTAFNHPFFQADGMFLGEMTCLIAFYLHRCWVRWRRHADVSSSVDVDSIELDVKFPRIVFYAPAFCDMLATSTMYLGLTLTYASSFQMLRGAVIVFTGLLSVAFLGRRLRSFQWVGIVFVILGLVVVGMSDFLADPDSTDGFDLNGVITGDLLIIAAQVVTATQMVIEEKYVIKYNIPALQAVGWEGIFGFITLTILMVPFYYLPAGIFGSNPRGVLEDALDAFVQLSNNSILVVAVVGNIVSISFFNFAGVSVTKELSATTRMVLDSVRTLFIWAFSLAVGWQKFFYLQPIGFIVLVIGMFLYNDVVIMPMLRWLGIVSEDPEDDLVPISSDAEGMANASFAISVPADQRRDGDVY